MADEVAALDPAAEDTWGDTPGGGIVLVGTLLIIAAAITIYIACNMTISLSMASDYSAVTGYTPARDVVNQELLQRQLMTFVGGCFLGVIGAIFIGAGRVIMTIAARRP